MRYLVQDIRYGLRTLAKAPLFTAIAVLSLALGIGANTAIFSLLDQVLLRLLPVKNPEQLVLFRSRGFHHGSNRGDNALSYPIYRDFRDRNQVFSGVMCRRSAALSLSFGGQTERISGELVSGNYFDVLGVKAAIGRTITPDDDRTPGGHPVVVLSHSFWKTRFAGDQSILGKTIHLNSLAMTVIGVSQEGFSGVDISDSTQVRVPIAMKKAMTPGWDDLENRRSRWVQAFGRLKPGVTLETAKASLQPLYRGIIETEVREAAFNNATPYTREQFLRSTIDLLPGSQGRPQARERMTAPLLVLMSVVALVLLISCANVANLLLARATARQKEFAVRLAIGAGRGRLVGQLLVESTLLSLLGGAAGLALAIWLDRALIGFLPNGGASVNLSATPDFRVLGFSLAVSIATGVLFGLAPALQSTRLDLASILKDQASGVLGGGPQARLKKALVVAQVALSLLLLVGAGLFLGSLRNLRNVDPGFKTENLISFTVDPRLNGYAVPQVRQTYQQLSERLNRIPGVKSAAFASVRLLDGDEWDSTITVEGYASKPGEDMNPHFNSVTAAYFATMGIPLVAGRDFSTRDAPDSPRVAIVNEKLARHYFGNRGPVGLHIGQGGGLGTKLDIEIVGVVKDTKYEGVREEIPRQVFVCSFQSLNPGEMTVYVRTALESTRMFNAVRAEVKSIDPNLPIFEMRTLDDQLDQSLLTERLVAALSTVFGFLATLLAVIGLYGVMTYTVTRRSREIGIRMALGAEAPNVVWLVMREVVKLVGAGIAIGLPAAWGLARLVRAQLYGVEPTDPVTIAAAAILLAAVAALAGYIPARRATRLDPVRVLRYE